jgi:hypothetical protein
MVAGVRVSVHMLALVFSAALLSAACDAGGLLVAQGKPNGDEPASGPSAMEIVNGGNYASNGQYRLFHTFGQPTPHQGVAQGAAHRNHGGLAGAVHSR